MYFVYILFSLKDKRTYVGYTNELGQRLQKHNTGQVRSTKHRRPLELLFTEKFQTGQEAKKRELYWKSGGGRRKLKKLFEGVATRGEQ
jgi:putative endonuclease